MSSWEGRVLRVDLSSGKIESETIVHEFRMDYLGARGINSRFLFDEVRPGIDPLSPDNVLIIGAGALNRMGIPGASRFTITAKSPLTGILGDANAGGGFAIELKGTGYDHIVFTGKAENPVYLWIDDARVEIRNAGNVWGKSTWETEEAIRKELGDEKVKVASIGQAGENLVRFACVVNEISNANGRTGMGAVMGSKNLKAIAVRGRKRIDIAHAEEFKVWKKDLLRKVGGNPYYPLKAKYGTPTLTVKLNNIGLLPARNLREIPAEGVEKISHEVLARRFTGARGCPGCFIHCKHDTEIMEGPYRGEKGGAIEFAATSSFGNHCGNLDPDSLLKLNNLSNQYGMDVFTAGHILGYAMDWYENGLITREDTDGIELRWGNWEGMIAMIHRIARREGFGDTLADGPVRAADQIGRGADRYISHVKGLEWSGSEDPRPLKGFALNLATSTRGACHERGLPSVEPFAGTLSDEAKEKIRKKFGTDDVLHPTPYTGKAGLVIHYQDISTASDALGLCHFFTEISAQTMGLTEMAEIFYLVTGIDIGQEGLRKVARRVYNIERAFLVREGIGKKDDYFSGKLGNEPVPGGPFKGESLDKEKFTKMLEEYYVLRGWDPDTGIPTRSTLEEYGLGDVADELEREQQSSRVNA